MPVRCTAPVSAFTDTTEMLSNRIESRPRPLSPQQQDVVVPVGRRHRRRIVGEDGCQGFPRGREKLLRGVDSAAGTDDEPQDRRHRHQRPRTGSRLDQPHEPQRVHGQHDPQHGVRQQHELHHEQDEPVDAQVDDQRRPHQRGDDRQHHQHPHEQGRGQPDPAEPLVAREHLGRTGHEELHRDEPPRPPRITFGDRVSGRRMGCSPRITPASAPRAGAGGRGGADTLTASPSGGGFSPRPAPRAPGRTARRDRRGDRRRHRGCARPAVRRSSRR